MSTDEMPDAAKRVLAKLEENMGASGNGSDETWDTAEIADRIAELEEALYTGPQLLSATPATSAPILGDLIRTGWRTILAGHSGEGKTKFGMSSVRAVLSEESLLGHEGVGGPVLYIDLEQDVGIAQRRIGEEWWRDRYIHGESQVSKLPDEFPELHDLHYWSLPGGVNLAQRPEDREAIEKNIARIRPRLVVIDPLYKTFIGSASEDELVQSVGQFIDGLRVKYEFGLLLPMHMRKRGKEGGAGGFDLHALYGAGQWAWGAEIILGIQRHGKRGASLHYFKDRAGDLPVKTAMNMEWDDTLGYVKPLQGEHPVTIVDQVLEALQERPGLFFTVNELAEYLNESKARLKEACNTIMGRAERGEWEDFLFIDKGGPRGAYRLRWGRPLTMVDDIKERFDAVEEDPP